MTYKEVKNIFFSLAVLPPTVVGFACNSRPMYNIELRQFDSNCAGQVSALVQYDPDPFVDRIEADPGYETVLADAGLSFQVFGNHLKAIFAAGIECTFSGDSQTSDCRITATNETAQCSSSLKIFCFRYPSQGPGFVDPIAKPVDCMVQLATDGSADKNLLSKKSTKD